jgi:hypothetical protein
MVLKAMLRRQAAHSDIDARLCWIALRIRPQNRPMPRRFRVEQNHVDIVVEFRVRLFWLRFALVPEASHFRSLLL